MPHFPYYRMDTDFPVCDSSLVVSSTQVYRAPQTEVKVYPNPANDKITVSFKESLTESYQLKIYDMIGQIVLSESLDRGATEVELSVGALPNGTYLLKVGEEKPVILKVMR